MTTTVEANSEKRDAAGRRSIEPAVQRLGIAELTARLGMHRNTIANWVRDGRFPAPHYIAEQRRWFLHEIVAWEQANTRFAATRVVPRPDIATRSGATG